MWELLPNHFECLHAAWLPVCLGWTDGWMDPLAFIYILAILMQPDILYSCSSNYRRMIVLAN